jgi:glycosyltransferase involved in cell wall biosynthesis
MGADLTDFVLPSPPREPDGAPLSFLFVGHAGRRKGIDTLLAASRRLQDAGVRHHVRCAGGADEGTFDDAPTTVEHLGYLGRQALVQAMHRADVLVLPSRHDSFGRVVVEGMATGLPALVSEHVGAKEVLREGESGWVVPAEDAEVLADRMQWCATHPDAVADMQAAAAAAAQHYTWAAYRERVTDVLENIVRDAVPS